MGIIIERLLICDAWVDGCAERFKIEFSLSLTEARAAAAAQGWSHPKRGSDLCPEHSKETP